MSQIFEGIRIIDLSQGMAGSMTTMILADYGAEVIRLEPPGGDPMWEHPAYLLWRRGKKSVALDWNSADGSAQARRLIADADIFIETLRPGQAATLDLGYETLQATNPALTYYSLAPFGQTGPYKDFELSDGIVNAKSGRMRDQISWQKQRPTFRAINDISYHTAMFTLQALVAALRVRPKTGRGQKLEGSLLSGASAPNNNWRLFEGQEIPEEPRGGYWRHAPVVKFSDTPCEIGKPYEGSATHTRDVLTPLGYDDATLDRLAKEKAIALEAQAIVPIQF